MPALAAAQDFPTKPIKLIVPFPAGGPNDIIARVVGQRMSELSSSRSDRKSRRTGRRARHRRGREGRARRLHHRDRQRELARHQPAMEKVPYDVAKDFAPITLVATVPEMLVVASNVPANDMAELIALAKAQPGKLNFASAGLGGLPHLAGELFKLTAKIDIVHVPYRGAAPAMNDLLGQQVQMTFLDLPVLLPHIKAGSAAADRARRAAARADRARCADHGGSRHARSADRELVRHDRAGRDAERDRRRAEQRRERGDGRSGR